MGPYSHLDMHCAREYVSHRVLFELGSYLVVVVASVVVVVGAFGSGVVGGPSHAQNPAQ